MKRRRNGFTLVEILVTTAMFSLLVVAALSVFSAGSRGAAKAKRYRDLVARGQTALEAMSADIRAAVAYRAANPAGSEAQPQAAAPQNAAPPQGGAAPQDAAAPQTAAAQPAPASTQPETTMTALDVQLNGHECDTLDMVIARPNPDYPSPDEGGRASVGYYLNSDPNAGPVGLLRRENRLPGDDPLTGGRVALSRPLSPI